MHIPFINLAQQYQNHREIHQAILSALSTFQFCKGEEVDKFENAFCELLRCNHCISTGNGTDSLFIALKALGIKKDDEVITPAFSWISTSETISLCGARPVFADIDPITYTIDPVAIEKKISPQTKAIIVVHLYGQAAHISAIKEICNKNKLFLIEDCAQAHLTQEYGKNVGTLGDVGTFSFYPTKNLGAYGDAGCMVTNNSVLAERFKRIANHGALKKDDHTMEGLNSRMDTLQAAILLAKLPFLTVWNSKRWNNAQLYNSLLKDIESITLPYERPDTIHTFHLYAIRTKNRDKLKAYLERKNIETAIHYPCALPNLPVYDYLNHSPSDFPVATAFQNETLSLPIYAELTAQQITYIGHSIKSFMSQN